MNPTAQVISMVKKQVSTGWLNKLIVSAYKVAGFLILAMIMLGLTSYIVGFTFFLVSRSWLSPTILSPSDEKVIKLGAQLAQESSLRDKLAAERRDVVGRLGHERQVIRVEEEFQRSFSLAMRAELTDRRAQRDRLARLVSDHQATKEEILRSSQAYSGMSRERLGELFEARLIDEDGLLSGSYELAQIAHSSLSLKEKTADLDTRIATLRRQVASLDAAASAISPAGIGYAGELSYEVLRLKREFDASVVEVERARDSEKAIEENLVAMDGTLARYDRIIQSIQSSPYLQAAEKDLTIAFAPYSNMKNVLRGSSVHRCLLIFVWCEQVGEVAEVLQGEVHGNHPAPGQGPTRGQMVRLHLRDGSAAQETLLHVGRAPLFFF